MEDVKITIVLKTDADLSCLLDIIEDYVESLTSEIESYEYEVEPAENIGVSVAYDEEDDKKE
tara:strand:+ start:18 stop:203 length:186 start_codon:yes stop_codon:yes gene_type:complete